MDQTILIVFALGLVALGGVLYRMTPGIGPYNLRAIGIVLIATFATILAVKVNGSLTAAMGILGSIGGYVFGIRDRM